MTYLASIGAVTPHVHRVPALGRTGGGAAHALVALLRRSGQPIILSSEALPDTHLFGAGPWSPRQGEADGAVRRHDRLPTGPEIEALGRCAPEGVAGRWQAIRLGYEGGAVDVVYAHLPVAACAEVAGAAIARDWPAAREAALAKTLSASPIELGLLRHLAGRAPMATLILDRTGRVRSGNTSGRALLERRDLLCAHGGIVRPTDLEARGAFRAELELQADGARERHNEVTLILRGAADGRPVPVTLSRVMTDGEPTGLVAVTVPRPPDPRAIRAVARLHGLTRSEAAIAELMHRGLSNREMAGSTGFSEETVKTYAKRILQKLDLSRCELVHLLTWQAEGGRFHE